MRLVIEPISAQAFAPYGTVVCSPADVGRNAYPDALLNKRPNARAMLSASRALPKTLPLTGTTMERRRFSSQTFFPLDVARYVVVVAPNRTGGMPDMERARALMVPGDTAITYAAGTWHHAMIALDRPACFSVLMWRDGTDADMDVVSLDRAFELAEA
ncbi:MAG: ureidoglycolate lyase [Hyphomicrobiales bacterium]|nr:ureidoglycolate lyase [Hyphomicrobiales bacterium]